MKKLFLISLAIIMVSGLVFGGCAAPAPELPKAASIGTMPKGGLTNFLGASVAKVISANSPISTVDRPFTGYLSFVPLINKGELEMGYVTCGEINYAYMGMEPYTERNKNLRLICTGTTLNTGFIVRADSGIKTVTDLKGKRVCWDTASKILVDTVTTMLNAHGLDWKDVTKVPTAGVVEQIKAVQEGRANTSWAAVGMPAVKEAAAKVGGLYWLPLAQSYDDAPAKYIREHLIGGDVKFLKKGVPTIDNDTWVFDQAMTLLTYQGFSDEAAYLIAKAIWENEAELVEIHKKFKGWQKAMASPKATIPYHDGAIRFYKEVGAWTAEMEKVQQKWLGQ